MRKRAPRVASLEHHNGVLSSCQPSADSSIEVLRPKGGLSSYLPGIDLAGTQKGPESRNIVPRGKCQLHRTLPL
jgi:hypothetical protein